MSFSQEKPDGPFKDYYKTGELKVEGQHKNNKRVGAWIAYHKNGQISSTFSYTNGKMDFEGTSFYENGVVRRKGVKENGIIVIRGYYESGKLFYERARKSGYYKEFREDGSLKVEANYLDYELYGKWRQYDVQSQLEWSVSYEKGSRNGIYESFYPNGKLKLKGIILKDKKQGEEKRFNENGNLLWKGAYTNNEFSKTWIKYDANGKKIKKIKVSKGVEDLDIEPTIVPDGVIERVAIFPGCEELFGNKARKKCINQNVAQLISVNFDINKAKGLGLKGKQRIFVTFKVDKYGYVSITKIKAPHPILRIEAQRVMQEMPRFTPGYQRGKPVAMPFSIPIVFMVE
ncbi:TonB family protein [Winogradskyella sp. PG-2]|nr:TonB family protein [Winogradskyella sp. PG-2]